MNQNYSTSDLNKNASTRNNSSIASISHFKTMKTSWLVMFLMLLSLAIGQKSWGQITTYSQNWSATGLNSWTTSGAGVAAARITTAAQICATTGTIRMEQYYGSSGQFISPLLGTSNGGLVTMNYLYKVTKFGAATTAEASANIGVITVEYASSTSGPWTVAQTINSANHVSANTCASKTVTFTPLPGNLYVRFNVVSNINYDDYYYFDDLTISQGSVTTPTITLATNNIAASNKTQGTTNNPIYSFAISPTVADATLTGLTVTTAGTYVAADLTNLKAWYQTSAQGSTFTGTGTLLSTKTLTLGAGSQVFPTFASQTITNGATGYIFITADVPCTAIATNTIAVSAVTGSNTTFALGTATGTPAAGNTQTISAATLSNVTSVSAASTSNVSATIAWTAPSCYDQVLIVGRAGSANDGTPTGDGSAYTGSLVFGSGTPLSSGFVVYKGTTSPQTITGLIFGTTYYFKIFTRLGTTWSAGVEVSVIPTYCTPSGTIASTYISNYTISGATTNINNTSTYSAGGYGNYSSTIAASQVAGSTVNYSITFVTGTVGLGIWVDWNQNGSFTDSGENVYNSTGYTSSGVLTYSGSFTVPLGATVGTTRMRVIADYNGSTPASCVAATSGQGEAEDYGFTVLALTPAVTLADNGTQVSAASISQGATNLVLHKSKLTVATAATSLTGMTCTTAGSYVSGDITNLKVWYSTASTFAVGTSTLLSTFTTPGTAGAKTFPSFTTQALPIGVYYIYITADVSVSAVNANTINVNALATTDFTFASGTKSGSTTAGGVQTFSASSIALSDNGTQVLASNVTPGTNNVVLHKSALTVTNASASLTGLTSTTVGSYVSADLTNLKVYYSTSSTFAVGTSTLLSTLVTPGAAGGKTFTSFVSQNLPVGTGYIYITADVSGSAVVGNTLNVSALAPSDFTFASGTVTGSTADGGVQTITSPVIVLADNGTQVAAANVFAGTTNLVLHKSQLTVAAINASLTGMTCTTAGTYASADLTNLKVYYSTNSTFAVGTSTLLSTFTTPGIAGAKTFPSFTSQNLPIGTGYIYITADVAAAATNTKTINVAAITTSNFTFAIGTKSGSTTVGGVQTFLAYCASTGDADTDGITGVSFSNMTNTTSNAATSAYTNYTSLVATVTQGFTYSGSTGLNVYINTGGAYTNYQTVYIDWNQNGVFTDSGETYALGTVNTVTNGVSSLCPLSITVPIGAIIGNTRMRVQTKYSSATTDSCLTGMDGEVEDYTINVLVAPACVTPTDNTTAITFGTTTATTIAGSFTAASTAPSGYLVVRSTSATLSANPIDGTSYVSGNTIGGGTVVQAPGASLTFSETGLTSNTQYYYFVFAYNNTACTGIKYTASFSNSKITCPAAPTVPTTSAITTTTATVSWTASVVGGSATAQSALTYTLEVYTDSGRTTLFAAAYTPGAGITTYDLTGLTPGYTYYYQIKANNGACDSTYLQDTFTTTAALPTITNFTPTNLCVAGGQTVTITGTNLSSISAVSFGGTAAASFTTGTGTSLTAVVPANVVNGIITITNPAGQASTAAYEVRTTPTTPTTAGAGAACSTATITASNAGDISDGNNDTAALIYYQGTSSTSTTTTTQSASQSVSASGTYYFRAISSYGCTSAAASAVVTISTPLTLSSQATATQSKCVGGTAFAALTVTVAGTGTPSYQWYSNDTNLNTGGTTVTTGTGGTTASYTPAAPIAGNVGTKYYYCVITGVVPCSTSLTSAVSGAITVNALPTITQTAPTTCTGKTVTLTGSGIAAVTTPWVSSNTAVATITPGGIASGVSSGTAGITYTDSNGCSSAATTLTVNVTPTAPTASASATPCLGGTINLSSTTSSAAVYTTESFETWPPAGWTFINAGNGNSWATYTTAAGVRTGLASMYYNYNISNAANAWAISPAKYLIAGVTYNVSAWYKTESYNEKFQITVGNAATVLAQTTQLANFPAGQQTTYTQITGTYTPTTSGTYYFGINCTSASNKFNLYIDDVVLPNESTINYSWTSNPSTTIAAVQNPTGITPAAGLNTYTVTANTASCASTASNTVSVTPNALPTAGITGVSSFCPGGNTLLTSNGVAGSGSISSYQWKYSADGIAYANVASGGTSDTYTATAAGFYTVTVTNTNTCSVTSIPFQVTQNTPATITVSGTATICNGQPTSLLASGAVSYSWSSSSIAPAPSGNNPSVSPSVTTTYTVTGTDSNGCTTNSPTVTVTVLSPLAAITASAPDYCIGSSINLSTTSAFVDAPVTYSWTSNPSGFTSTVQNPTGVSPSGTVTYTVTATNGYCSTNSSVTVHQNPLPTIAVSDETICNGSSVFLSATGATNYTWAPATGLSATTGTSVTANPTATQGYTITGTDDNGCVNTTTATVTVTQPGSITSATPLQVVIPGQQATFHVTTAAGPVAYSYQWQVSTDSGTSWTNLSNDYIASPVSGNYSGVNTNTLNIDNILADPSFDGYLYHCLVTGDAPCTALTSTPGTLTMSNVGYLNQPVSATKCSSDTTVTYTAVTTGDDPYAVSEEGVEPIVYATGWQIFTGVIDAGNEVYDSIVDGYDTNTGLTYATSDVRTILQADPLIVSHTLTLTVTGFTPANSGYKFKSLVNFYLSSSSASLTVNPAVGITTPPADKTICSGTTTSLSVVATNATAYQWQVDTGSGFTAISNANAATLSLTSVPYASNGNVYNCIVTGLNGCSSVTTASATLTVNDAVAVQTAPVTAVSLCSGESTVLSVAATATDIAYQWQLSTNGGSTYTDIVSATSASYTITTATPSMNGYKYQVVISGAAPCSAVTPTATTLTVNTPVVVGTPPASATVCSGTTATFTVGATGTGLNYQWQVSTNGGSSWSTVGTNAATLSLAAVTVGMNSNQYQVIVSGASPCTSFTPSPVTLTVNPAITTTNPTNQTVCIGGTATYSVTASNVVSYQWEVSTDTGSNWLPIGTDSASLSVTGATAGMSGNQYRVTMTGIAPCSSITTTVATLTVKSPVAITLQPASQSTCSVGTVANTAIFSVTATGDNLTYQWEVSTNSGGSWSPYAGVDATSASITITNPAVGLNNNQYHVIVTGSATCSSNSQTSDSATLTVKNPTLLTQPASKTIGVPGTANFTVTTGESSPSYQWQYATSLGGTYNNVAALPTGFAYTGATTSSLNASATATSVAGVNNWYRVLMTAQGCAVPSTPAQLTVVDYCANTTTTTTTYINTFTTTGGITNISNATNAISANGYGNFITQSVSQYANSPINYTLTITAPSTGSAAIWVDWNADGDFVDAGENTVAATTSLTGSFTVPSTAAVGSYRMRVVFNRTTAPAACSVSTNRTEAEDYTVTVVAIPPCSGAPTPGTTTVSASSLCGTSSTVTLTNTGSSTNLTGLTKQWYSSTDNVTFTPISGATATPYTTAAVTVTTYYKYVVTCTNGPASADSNTVTVTVNNPTVSGLQDVSRCGPGTVSLTGTPSSGAQLDWYAASTGGTSLFTGNTYQPNVTGTTTYYVEASTAAAATPAMTYCSSTTTGTTYYISSFSTTGGSTNITNASGNLSASGYGDFTSQKVAQAAGSSVNFSVSLYDGFYSYGVGIWVDWNNDGDFLDVNERPYNSAAYVYSASGSITVPSGTPKGTYRMRVRADYNATSPSECGSIAGGETEDYIFEVTACKAASRVPVVVTVTTPPAIALSSSSATICSGDTTAVVTITPETIGNFTNYSWSPTGVSGTSGAGYTFNPTVTTAYTLTATNASCSNTAAFAVTVNALPTGVTATSSSTVICSGQTINLTGAGVSAPVVNLINPTTDGGFELGTTFTANGWTGITGANGAWYSNTSAITSGTSTFTPTGNRSIYFSNTSGVSWKYGAADGSDISGASHFYRNVTFPAGATNMNLSFRWNAYGNDTTYDVLYVYLCPNTLTPVANSPSSNSNAVTWSGTGSATLLGTYSALSSGGGQTSSITITPAQAANAAANSNMRLVFTWKNDGTGGSEPPVAIDDIALNVTTPETLTYAWTSTPSGYSSAVVSPTNVVPTQTATYKLRVSRPNGCFAEATTALVTVNPTPAVPTVATTAPTCSADGFTTITNYSAANTYTFLPSGPTVGSGGSITGATLGTPYTITATLGSCTSGSSASFTNLVMLPTPAVPTVSTVAPTCSANGSTTITNYSASNTYTFSPSGPTAGSGGSISNATLGQAYTITATNGSGCTSGSSSFTNLVILPTPAVPTISAGGPTTFCSGGSVVLTSSAGTSYLWSPGGATTASITVSTAGNYTVQVTNAVGCQSLASAATTVAVTAQPEWFADVDNDGYSSSSAASIFSCTRPVGYKLASELVNGGVGSTATDCVDVPADLSVNPLNVLPVNINPARSEVCYNNVDDNCSGVKSEGCAAVPVTVVNGSPASFSSFSCSFYTYPGATTIGYQIEIERFANGVSAGPAVTLPIQTSRFFSIPTNMRVYTTDNTLTTYKIRASAVINGEVVGYYYAPVTFGSYTIPTVQLSACPTTLTGVSGSLSANLGFNATDYSFRIRLTSDNGTNPTYYYINNSASRFVNSNSFEGFQLQYG
ncbi:GEVED domain-containing protein, partial [Flavobacterium paronense]